MLTDLLNRLLSKLFPVRLNESVELSSLNEYWTREAKHP